MPYLKKERRRELSKGQEPETPGDLNYLFTIIIKEYLDIKDQSYQTYNDIIGALEACKLELYRRKAVPYEDKKIGKNGDVF